MGGTPNRSVEKFLTDMLIGQLQNIEMFEFAPASPTTTPDRTLVGRIETEWPVRGDAILPGSGDLGNAAHVLR